MDNTNRLLLEYNLQFFAEGPGGEKTEPATQKKLDDARKEGKVAKSKELVSSVTLFAFFMLLKLYVGSMGKGFIEVFTESYGLIPEVVEDSKIEFSTVTVMSLIQNGIIKIITILLPVLLVGFLVVAVVNIFQVKWKPTSEPLMPKLDKFNPINGIKRMFSASTLVELLKNIVMIGVIIYIAYSTMKDKYNVIYTLYEVPLKQAVEITGDLVISLGVKISALFLVVGLADYMYQVFKFKKDMMMTKQEIKDEYKQSEGDPIVKGQRRQKMREASRRRMMNDLPKADVVITNPTHFAVALQYDTEVAPAPVVLAKGADYVAFQIRDKAKELDIEIVENKPLARMLYHNVDVGAEIPPELYQAVAEILAVVYSTKPQKTM